jgi:hypothetical protein
MVPLRRLLVNIWRHGSIKRRTLGLFVSTRFPKVWAVASHRTCKPDICSEPLCPSPRKSTRSVCNDVSSTQRSAQTGLSLDKLRRTISRSTAKLRTPSPEPTLRSATAAWTPCHSATTTTTSGKSPTVVMRFVQRAKTELIIAESVFSRSRSHSFPRIPLHNNLTPSQPALAQPTTTPTFS